MIQRSASVSLHIRRGDYVHSAARDLFGGVCDIGYYNSALALLKSKIPDVSVYVFSDEIEWAKANLSHANTVFLEQCADYEEMFLMSRCEHNIIANSSFSWWGAWLNTNAEKIVIAPRRWHKTGGNALTPVPASWTRL